MTDSTPMRSVRSLAAGSPEDVAAVRRAVMRLNRRLRVERTPSEVSPLLLGLLGHLQSRGSLTPTQLAALERVHLQSLTRAIADLQDKRLIERAVDTRDRRRSVLRITPAGQGVLERDMRSRDHWLAAAMAAVLTPTERALVHLAAGLLDRLAD